MACQFSVLTFWIMDSISQIKKDFHRKKILVFGLGLQGGGLQTVKFFASLGNTVRVSDLKNEQQLEPSIQALTSYKYVSFTLGEHRYSDIDWADVVIPNPGMRFDSPFLVYAQKHKKEIHLEIGLFLKYTPATIIGITGTRGKSTTTNLIYHILKSHLSVPVHLAGNIPQRTAISLLKTATKNDIVVLELSSWQLHGLLYDKISPHIAVFTNIYPDHLNYYPSMEEYTEDKVRIFAYQKKGDFAVITDQVARNNSVKKKIKSSITVIRPDTFTWPLPNLIGIHNKANAALALTVARLMGISDNKTVASIQEFRGLPFRIEYLGTIKGVPIYNDSTSTTPIACETALNAISSEYPQGRILLIAGGNEKNLPFDSVAQKINETASHIFLLPGSFTDILRPHLSIPCKGPYNNLSELVNAVLSELRPGDVVLFSPAATSFASFKNEFDRGEQFSKLIRLQQNRQNDTKE